MDPATNESLNDEPKLIPKTPLFTRPAFLSLTIGVPFCIFKILFGIQFIRAADIHSQRATWMELAAGRRLDQVGRAARDAAQLLRARAQLWNGLQQTESVGVARAVK